MKKRMVQMIIFSSILMVSACGCSEFIDSQEGSAFTTTKGENTTESTEEKNEERSEIDSSTIQTEAESVNTEDAANDKQYSEDIVDITDYYSISASSEQDGYSVDYVTDKDLTTAWVDGKDDYGIGETISFEGVRYEALLTSIQIASGYHKSDDLLEKNSQPSSLTLTVNGDSTYDFELSQTTKAGDYLEYTFDEPVELGLLEIEINDVYKGTKYSDTCISEIVLMGHEPDFDNMPAENDYGMDNNQAEGVLSDEPDTFIDWNGKYIGENGVSIVLEDKGDSVQITDPNRGRSINVDKQDDGTLAIINNDGTTVQMKVEMYESGTGISITESDSFKKVLPEDFSGEYELDIPTANVENANGNASFETIASKCNPFEEYRSYLRTPEAYMHNFYTGKVKVIQVYKEDGGMTSYNCYMYKGDECTYDNVYIYDQQLADRPIKIVEGDIIQFYGIYTDNTTMTMSLTGNTIEVPRFALEYCDLLN